MRIRINGRPSRDPHSLSFETGMLRFVLIFHSLMQNRLIYHAYTLATTTRPVHMAFVLCAVPVANRLLPIPFELARSTLLGHSIDCIVPTISYCICATINSYSSLHQTHLAALETSVNHDDAHHSLRFVQSVNATQLSVCQLGLCTIHLQQQRWQDSRSVYRAMTNVTVDRSLHKFVKPIKLWQYQTDSRSISQ